MAPSQAHVIVGGGQAGACAAMAMREAGFDGPITVIAEEPHPPYERPSLSKELLRTGAGPVFIWPSGWQDENGVTLLSGTRAMHLDLDRHVVTTSDYGEIAFNRLLLATGGIVRRLELAGTHLAGICALRSLDEASALRVALTTARRLIVIGGGLIGLEVAASARRLGVDVTVLEAAPALLGRIAPAEIAALALQTHLEHGVDIRLNVQPASFLGRTHLQSVKLVDGTVIEGDLAVVGIGITPATDLAARAGLAVDDGILVNQRCRSSHRRVYAAGDCARQMRPNGGRALRLENWTNARKQAAVAARNMCGANEAFDEVPWGWSEQYDLLLQFAGAPLCWTNRIVRRLRNGLLVLELDGGIVTAAAGVNCSKEMLLASHMIKARTHVDPTLLQDPSQPLKAMLKSA
ncbi:MAG TPA: FAD-dependent oxidoreductase [Hyphomicrobiaceae bacterium]